MDRTAIQAWDAKYAGEAMIAQTLGAVTRLTSGSKVARILLEIEGTVRPGWRVLEAGSGTGRLTLALASKIRIQGIGLDYSRTSVEVSQEAARRLSIDAKFLQGDLRALPFPNGTFELVFSDSVIEHIPEYLYVLREVARVTMPGGWVLVSVPNRLRPDGWDLYRLIRRPDYPQTSFTPWGLREDLREVGLVPCCMFGGDVLLSGWLRPAAPKPCVAVAAGGAIMKKRDLLRTLRSVMDRTFPEWFRIDIGWVARKI